jgi:hypothetical protein
VAPKEVSARNPPPAHYEYHWLEAEHFTKDYLPENLIVNLAKPENTSGEGAINIIKSNTADNDLDGNISYCRMGQVIDIKETGIYYIWVRGKTDNPKRDIITVGIQGRKLSDNNLITSFRPGWSWSRNTLSRVVANLNISKAGPQTVNLWMKDDGFHVDKILITNDPFFIPKGLGDPANNITKTKSAGSSN